MMTTNYVMMNTNYNDKQMMMNSIQTIMVNKNYDEHKTCVQLLSINFFFSEVSLQLIPIKPSIPGNVKGSYCVICVLIQYT